MGVRRYTLHIAAASALMVLFATSSHGQTKPAAELSKAIALLEKGSAGTAARHLTRVIESSDRSSEDLARAFLYRAKAYYRMKRPAEALADLNAAAWLDKLSSSEKSELQALRARAGASAGVANNAGSAPIATSSVESGWSTRIIRRD
jgi:tetratricopeptide (TPR) repeat protein